MSITLTITGENAEEFEARIAGVVALFGRQLPAQTPGEHLVEAAREAVEIARNPPADMLSAVQTAQSAPIEPTEVTAPENPPKRRGRPPKATAPDVGVNSAPEEVPAVATAAPEPLTAAQAERVKHPDAISDGELTIEDMRDALRGLAQRKDMTAARGILDEFNVSKVSELAQAQYVAFKARAEGWQ